MTARGKCKIESNLILVDPETLETDIPGIFASGDVGRGPSTVVETIAERRRPARSIDKSLDWDGILEETHAERPDNWTFTYKDRRK